MKSTNARTKTEVATERLPKTEIIEQAVMETVQREIYESIRLSMHGRTGGRRSAAS